MEMKRSIIIIFIGILFAVSFVFLAPLSKTSEPKPETELIKMVGESFKKNPENWRLITEDRFFSTYYFFDNIKCKIHVDYSKGSYRDSTYLSNGNFAFLIENENKFEDLEDNDMFAWFKRNCSGIYEISQPLITDQKSKVPLSIKDIAYLEYQYEKFILPLLNIKICKEDSVARMNKRIQEIIESKRQDKLRETNYNKLKNSSCL